MTRGRKPFADKRVRREVSLPETLALRIDLLAHDPLRGKPRSGEWSRIVIEALQAWLLKQSLRGEQDYAIMAPSSTPLGKDIQNGD